MFSGKTGKVIEQFRKSSFCKLRILVINYSEDTRYSQTELSTHDKTMIPCIQTKTLESLYIDYKKEVSEADVILINEGQFFPDLYSWVSKLLDTTKKHIYVCGLDGDSKRNKFGQILDLIPLSDKVTKLTAICGICKDGTPAIFSLRCSKELEQKVIGTDNYIPVCRNCYIKTI